MLIEDDFKLAEQSDDFEKPDGIAVVEKDTLSTFWH